MKKTKTKAPERMLRGDPVRSVPSVWIGILGLIDGDGWYELYQAENDREAKMFLGIAMDADDACHERYSDFAIWPPELEHSIPANVRGQHRSWLESISPATAARRAAALVQHAGATRGVAVRRKRSS